MKRLFIYYSLSGNGDFVANYLKGKDIETRKVSTKEKISKSMFLKILKGGFLAGINYKAKLDNFNKNIEEYDEVIIGSPVWNGRFSCAINTVIDELKLDNKNIRFILYSGSGTAPKAEEIIKERFKNAQVINLKEPKKNKEELEKINI